MQGLETGRVQKIKINEYHNWEDHFQKVLNPSFSIARKLQFLFKFNNNVELDKFEIKLIFQVYFCKSFSRICHEIDIRKSWTEIIVIWNHEFNYFFQKMHLVPFGNDLLNFKYGLIE